jgi:predicted aspartyl protease
MMGNCEYSESVVHAEYDSGNFSPPAPILSVTIWNEDRNKSYHAPAALIDTGCDMTIIPQVWSRDLNLVLVDQRVVTGVFGDESDICPVYAARVQILDVYEDLERVIGLGSTLLIGRDILRRFVTTLNGIESVLSLK